jgi:hypothetical protein
MPTQRPAVPRAEHQRRLKSFTSFCEARGIGPAALKGPQSGERRRCGTARLVQVCIRARASAVPSKLSLLFFPRALGNPDPSLRRGMGLSGDSGRPRLPEAFRAGEYPKAVLVLT